MKPLFTLFVLLFCLIAHAQKFHEAVLMPMDSTTGEIMFRNVVSVDASLDTKAVIQKARSWVANTYRSSNDVVQQYDQEAGILIAKGQFPVTKSQDYRFMGQQTTSFQLNVYQTLTIEAKPGRYRVTLTNFELATPAGQRAPLPSNRGNMTAEEYMESVRKYVAGQPMEKASIRYAEKNMDATITSDRIFMADVKAKCEAMLESLKQYMQKKGEKDW